MKATYGDLEYWNINYQIFRVNGCSSKISDRCCVYSRDKVKGQSSREINGYNMWYLGMDDKRNGVRILISTKFKNNVVLVQRCNDRFM